MCLAICVRFEETSYQACFGSVKALMSMPDYDTYEACKASIALESGSLLSICMVSSCIYSALRNHTDCATTMCSLSNNIMIVTTPLMHLTLFCSLSMMPHLSREDMESISELCRVNASHLDTASAAFYAALENNESLPWNRTRLMVLGHERVGKTATIRSLLGEEFRPQWRSTVGVSLTEVSATSSGLSKSAQTRGPRFASELAHKAAADAFTRSRSDQVTTESDLQYGGVAGLGLGLVKSIASVAQRVLGQESGEDGRGVTKKLSEGRSRGRPVNEDTSRKSRSNLPKREQKVEENFDFDPKGDVLDVDSLRMSIWDYGGQRVFYGIHHLFLSPFGLYLIVFDIHVMAQEKEDAEMGDQVIYWLKCIHMYAKTASAMLVGTCLDRLPQDNAASIARVNHRLARRLLQQPTKPAYTPSSAASSTAIPNGESVVSPTSSVLVNSEQDLLYFPISNKDGSGVEALKRTIYSTVRAQPHTRRKVPMAWMHILDAAIVEDRPWLNMSRVKELAAAEGVTSSTELLTLLKFCTELGTLVHLTLSVTLAETVVLDAQWLVDQMAKVIRDGDVHVGDLQEVSKAELRNDWLRLYKHGLVSRDLLTFFWPAKVSDFLQEFMLKLLLISEWRHGDVAGSSEMFLVPSMVRKALELRPEGAKVEFIFKDGFMPVGVFERLVCLAVQYSAHRESKEPLVGRDACRLCDAETGPVCMVKSSDKLTICVEQNLQKQQHSKVLETFVAMLRRVKAEAFGPGLEYTVWVEDSEASRMVKMETAKAQLLKPWFNASEKQKSLNLRIESFLEES